MKIEDNKKMNRVAISIIVPVYNRARVLGTCLDSILNQSYADWECIVVNDGSTDETLRVCEAFARRDSRFVVYSQENGGVSAARNKALDHACGTYITFVDSDDYIDPAYLQKLMDAIQGHDLSIGWTISHQMEKASGYGYQDHPAKTILMDGRHEADFLHLEKLHLLSGPVCKLFRRQIIEEHRVRFPEDISYGEDMIFNFTYMSFIESLRVIPDILYYVIKTPGSLSDLNVKRYPLSLYLVLHNARKHLLENKGMDGSQVRLHLSFLYCFQCWQGVSYIVSKHKELTFSGRYGYLKSEMASLDTCLADSASGYSTWRRFLMKHPLPAFLFFEMKYLFTAINFTSIKT